MQLISIFVLLLLSLFQPASAAVTLPDKPVGFVTDFTGKLKAGEKQALEAKLATYKKTTSNEIIVVIIPSAEAMGESGLDTAAQAIGDKWKPGAKDKNNGLIILVSGTATPYKARIATGRGLEGAVPDIIANKIVQEVMKPLMNSGSFYEGIDAGIDALSKRIGNEFTPDKKATSAGQMSSLAIVGICILGVLIAFFVGMLTPFISLIVGVAAAWIAFTFGWIVLLGAVVGYIVGMLGRALRTSGSSADMSDIATGGVDLSSVGDVVGDVISAAGDIAGGGGGDI